MPQEGWPGQLETASQINQWLSSPELKPPEQSRFGLSKLFSSLCRQVAVSRSLILQIGLELWIHSPGTRQQLELERVLKIFCNHFHGPPPLANVSTGYKLTGKQAQGTRRKCSRRTLAARRKLRLPAHSPDDAPS